MLKQANSMSPATLPPNDELFSLLLASATDYILMVLDAVGTIGVWSSGAQRLLGYAANEVVGQHFAMLFTADDQAQAVPAQLLQQAQAAGQLESEYGLVRNDGTCLQARVQTLPLWDEQPNLRGFVVFANWTERQTAQRDMRWNMETAERRYRLLLESTGEGMYGLDMAGNCTFINSAAARLLGYAVQEVIGKDMHRQIHHHQANAEPYPEANCRIYQALHSGTSIRLDNEMLWRKDGSAFPVEYSSHPLIEDGVIQGAVVTFRDITERKQAEHAHQAQVRTAAFGAAVGLALTQQHTLAAMLHGCAQAMVDHLDAAFARIWLFDEVQQLLTLTASAGMYTHLDGPHSRVPLGTFKIGWIAQERTPHLTNSVINDPLVHNQEWAVREGMIAFAGYPLIVGNRLIGVMAMFARQPLTPTVLQVLEAMGNGIAVGIERTQIEAEHVRLLASEQAARQAAQAAVQVRDLFLSTAAHELKTPLTVLMGHTQTIQRRMAREEHVSERNQRSLAAIREHAGRLNQMIDALLDISRLESGQLTIKCVPLNLTALLEQVIQDVQPGLQRHVITFVAQDSPIYITGDDMRLRQVMHNLLSNAIKYSPNGGTVIVQAARHAEQARISVTDQGVGIPQTAIPHLFQRFYRATNVTEHHIQGIGIGLYVVYELVALHGGTITVESTENEGSVFSVSLPLLAQDGQRYDQP